MKRTKTQSNQNHPKNDNMNANYPASWLIGLIFAGQTLAAPLPDQINVNALKHLKKQGYEVWLSDQVNTQGISGDNHDGTHGGKVHIYDGSDLEQNPPVNRPRVLDVTDHLFPDADQTTGAHVARIHGILPSPDHRYLTLNFVASGHLGIVDGETKTPVCLFRTTETATGRQNHMSFWTPDGKAIIVANQNGRMLERVDVKRGAGGEISGFEFNASASLDLVGGENRIKTQPIAIDSNSNDNISCTIKGTVADNQPTTTPTGALKQAENVRPVNSVICPIPASNSQHVFTTLGGGGLFVVDIHSEPMSIVAEYDANVVHAAGCGGVEAAGFMHLNTGTPGPNISEFTLYRFPLDYPSTPDFNSPNTPEPIAVWEDPDNGKTLVDNMNRDAHGLVLIHNTVSGTPRFLHQFDRIRNNVEVFKVAPPWNDLAFRHEGSYSLTTTGACGSTLGADAANDPTPDLGELSLAGVPDGRRIYVALRGPFPLSVSHAADGSCPGLGIITLSPDRRSGTLTHVLPTEQLDYENLRNLSDPHAAMVRVKAQ
jgi:hypothetical protein